MQKAMRLIRENIDGILKTLNCAETEGTLWYRMKKNFTLHKTKLCNKKRQATN